MVSLGPSTEELHSRRLVLRRPTRSDVESVLVIHQDPLTTGHNPSDRLDNFSEAEALFGRWDQHWATHGFGYWVVRRSDEQTQLGFCGLKLMTLGDELVLNLLYRFRPASWHQGLASEAAAVVVGWAAIHQGAYRVIARVRLANVASHRVALNAGLVRTAELDGPGIDGLDCIYVSKPDRRSAVGPRRATALYLAASSDSQGEPLSPWGPPELRSGSLVVEAANDASDSWTHVDVDAASTSAVSFTQVHPAVAHEH